MASGKEQISHGTVGGIEDFCEVLKDIAVDRVDINFGTVTSFMGSTLKDIEYRTEIFNLPKKAYYSELVGRIGAARVKVLGSYTERFIIKRKELEKIGEIFDLTKSLDVFPSQSEVLNTFQKRYKRVFQEYEEIIRGGRLFDEYDSLQLEKIDLTLACLDKTIGWRDLLLEQLPRGFEIDVYEAHNTQTDTPILGDRPLVFTEIKGSKTKVPEEGLEEKRAQLLGILESPESFLTGLRHKAGLYEPKVKNRILK